MKREYYSVDEDGYILDVHLFDPEYDHIPPNCKIGWVDGLHKPRYDHSLGQWVEDKTKEEFLVDARAAKDRELNLACEQAILAGFSHTIDGQAYWFSYDEKAQSNFGDAKLAFMDGIATVIPWTVRIGGKDGEYTRIAITPEIMRELSLVILNHKNGHIQKYRDFLMPVVNSATEIDEINEVVW